MSTQKMRVLVLTLASLSFFSQGCAVFGMVSPPVNHQELEQVDCSWRKAWPMMDLHAAGWGLYGLLVGLAAENSLMAVMGGAVTAVHGGSSLYGFGQAETCREARSQAHVRAMERDRRQDSREFRVLKQILRSSGGHFQNDEKGTQDSLSSSVSRMVDPSSGKTHAVAEFRFPDNMGVRIHAAPGGEPPEVVMALWIDSARHKFLACEKLALSVNAAPVEVSAPTNRERGRRTAVTGKFSAESLAQLSAPLPSVALNYCGLELPFNAEQLDGLRGFRLILQDLASQSAADPAP